MAKHRRNNSVDIWFGRERKKIKKSHTEFHAYIKNEPLVRTFMARYLIF